MIIIILVLATVVLSIGAAVQYIKKKRIEKELTNYLLHTSQTLNAQMNVYRKLQEGLVDDVKELEGQN